MSDGVSFVPRGLSRCPRLQSLDAFRGLIMLMMGSAGSRSARSPVGCRRRLGIPGEQTDHT
jgi:hypothetical protein